MARTLHVLIVALCALVQMGMCPGLRAQDQPQPPPPPPQGDQPPNPPPGTERPRDGDRGDGGRRQRRAREEGILPQDVPQEPEARKRWFESLPPEKRKELRENLKRWQEMEPQKRDALRDQADLRSRMMNREFENTIKNLGLTLDKDQLEVFRLRYFQERRKIEEQLRREMDEKRRPLIRAMTEDLKKEFEGRASEAVSPPLPPSSGNPPKENAAP